MASARFFEKILAQKNAYEGWQRSSLYLLQKNPEDAQARVRFDFYQRKQDEMAALMRRANDGESDAKLRPEFERIVSEYREGGDDHATA